MKTLPINNSTYHNNFKGLWRNGSPIATDANSISVTHEITDYYYPFLNEPKEAIESALKSRTYHYSCGSADTFSVDIFNNYAELAKELTFTEKEYRAYKHFYGDIMPEAIKKVEDGLKAFGLDKYLNRGIVYNVKKFIHNIKR